jgi:hypothetical protein
MEIPPTCASLNECDAWLNGSDPDVVHRLTLPLYGGVAGPHWSVVVCAFSDEDAEAPDEPGRNAEDVLIGLSYEAADQDEAPAVVDGLGGFRGSIFVQGVKDGGQTTAISAGANAAPLAGCNTPFNYIFSLREMREAAAQGFKLRIVVCLQKAQPLQLDDCLSVPAADGHYAEYSSSLGGPFSDAVVRAGGREWAVHRVVLAAASPVFRAMLGEAAMVEGRTATIELRDVEDPAVVDLLLQNIYGAAIEVPLRLAPLLYKLAEQYMLKTGLDWRLVSLLSTVPLEVGTLGALLPLAISACPEVCGYNFYHQAADHLIDLEPDCLANWTLDSLYRTLICCRSSVAKLRAALGWLDGQQLPARDRAGKWAELLDIVDLGRDTPAGLREVQAAIGADARFSEAAAPGLRAALMEAVLKLCDQQQADLAAAEAALAASEARREADQMRIQNLEQLVVQWQGLAVRAPPL